jgi:hypothetical protein
MGKLVDRTGHRYGRLEVLERDLTAGPANFGVRVRWRCRCDCGSVLSVTGHELASGDTRSCGCYRDERIGRQNRTHALSKTPTYLSWQAAKSRCYNPKTVNYPSYGGAGITVCDRWRDSFENFLSDMGKRPKGCTLDRIDPCGHYEPSNCRWATPKEQTATTSRLRYYNWRGRQMLINEIAETEGIPRTSLAKALRREPNVKKAVAYVRSRLGRSGIQNLFPPTLPPS